MQHVIFSHFYTFHTLTTFPIFGFKKLAKILKSQFFPVFWVKKFEIPAFPSFLAKKLQIPAFPAFPSFVDTMKYK